MVDTTAIASLMAVAVVLYMLYVLFVKGRDTWISKYGTPEQREQLRMAQIEDAKHRKEMEKHRPKKKKKDELFD